MVMIPNVLTKTRHIAIGMAAFCAASALTACDSLIFDDEGDCTVHYRVPFTFTQNILNSDAFASQVSRVNLYVFDKSGQLVTQKSETRQLSQADDYRMDVELLPGTYDMIAWCEGIPAMEHHTAFVTGEGPDITDCGASLPLKGSPGAQYNDLDITPLFYGAVSNVDCADTDYGYVDLPAIDLMKDTNVIKVVLNNIDGREMKGSDFTISVEADNAGLDYTNAPAGSTRFLSLPWSVASIIPEPQNRDTGSRTDAGADGRQNVTGLMAEITLGRLVAGHRTVFTVTRNSDGVKLFNFDLIDYILQVKGHYPLNYNNQAYLDRMDNYELTFFLDGDLNWYTAGGVFINGWRVVPPQTEEF